MRHYRKVLSSWINWSATDFRRVIQVDNWRFGWLCWGLTSQSTIFQSYRDGAIASWVSNQYFRGVKCLAQGHNTAVVGFEPRTSRSGVRHSTTEPPRSPDNWRISGITQPKSVIFREEIFSPLVFAKWCFFVPKIIFLRIWRQITWRENWLTGMTVQSKWYHGEKT